MNKNLSGINVAVTRPSIYSSFLEQGIRAQKGIPVMLPAIEIVEVDSKETKKRLDCLDATHYIFVSRSAARIGGALILEQGRIMYDSKFYAIGEGTKRELLSLGFKSISLPETGQDSEALLRVPSLQNIAGKKLVVVRGNGGRLILNKGLEERGGIVKNFECYVRKKPIWNAELMNLVNNNQISAW